MPHKRLKVNQNDTAHKSNLKQFVVVIVVEKS